MLGSRDDQLPMKLTKILSQGSEASLIVLTTYFHGASPIKLQELAIYDLTRTWTIFMSNKLVILSTHTRQLTSPLSISQLPINTDERSFKHFIEHLVGMRENPKF